MSAGGMRAAMALAALAWCAAANASASDAIWTDQFMHESEPGAVGLLHGTGKKVRSGSHSGVIQFAQGDRCSLMVNHRDPGRVGQQTFIGVQLIRFFAPEHPILDPVSVYRNAGWVSADGKQLGVLQPRSLLNSSLSDFQQMHSEAVAKSSPPHPLMAQRAIDWHAKYSALDASAYTASEEHIRFWGQDPITIESIRQTHLARPEKPAILVENRLIRFQFTDGVEAGKAPRIEVSCPRTLLSAAVRIYKPFSTSQIEIVNIRFR